MEKLKLNLEDLELESFETMAPKQGASGTVHGQTGGYQTTPDECCWSWDATFDGCITGCDDSTRTTPTCENTNQWSYCHCFTAPDSSCTMT